MSDTTSTSGSVGQAGIQQVYAGAGKKPRVSIRKKTSPTGREGYMVTHHAGHGPMYNPKVFVESQRAADASKAKFAAGEQPSAEDMSLKDDDPNLGGNVISIFRDRRAK